MRFIRVDDDPQSANTIVTFERLGGSTIGLAVVPRNPQCGATIWAKYSTTYRPSQLLHQWARLKAHEFFHNMGGSHGPSGITAPTIQSGVFTRTAWRGDFAFPQLKRWFGGEPLDLTPPDPPHWRYEFRGEQKLFNPAGEFVGSFQLKRTQPPTFNSVDVSESLRLRPGG